MRTFILLVVCAALCASCSGGASGITEDAQRFSLTVLPESYDLGGSAETSLTTRPEPGGLAVDVVASADGLKAFYFELGYDASQWHPVTVEQKLGTDSQVLQIASTEDAGTVHAGRVLVHPDGCEGISGELTVATVHFAPGAATPSRGISDVPDRDGSKAVLSIDGAGLLSWKYASIGDYDQNREVNVADLSPIAREIGEATGGGKFDYSLAVSVVDGDENGEVNIADISSIAGNIGNTVAEYAVYRSQSTADYPASNTEAPKLAAIASVPFDNGVGVATQVRLSFTFDASAVGGDDPANIFWVRPVDNEGNNGSPSNQVSPAAAGNVAPVISAFTTDTNPVATGGTANLTATASDADGDTLTYSYNTTAGTVDQTGTNTTVFHAPTVAVPTDVTVTVTVDDGQGHAPTRNVTITVNPDAVTEVHIEFSPVAEGGSGTNADAFGLAGDSDYTFTATDQAGNDITGQTTFEWVNDPDGDPWIQGDFTGSVFTTSPVGFGNFHVIGTYHKGLPDEVVSDPDLVTEERHFTIVLVLP